MSARRFISTLVFSAALWGCGDEAPKTSRVVPVSEPESASTDPTRDDQSSTKAPRRIATH